MLLSTGCLCCTVRGDLVNTLEKLLRGLDNGRMKFNRVIIETTGLADPAPVLHTAMVHPYLRAALPARRRRDGGRCGERRRDARRACRGREAGRGRGPHRADQDRPDRHAERREALAALRARLAALNPAAPVIEARGRERRAADRLRALRRRAQDPRREALARRRKPTRPRTITITIITT